MHIMCDTLHVWWLQPPVLYYDLLWRQAEWWHSVSDIWHGPDEGHVVDAGPSRQTSSAFRVAPVTHGHSHRQRPIRRRDVHDVTQWRHVAVAAVAEDRQHAVRWSMFHDSSLCRHVSRCLPRTSTRHTQHHLGRWYVKRHSLTSNNTKSSKQLDIMTSCTVEINGHRR